MNKATLGLGSNLAGPLPQQSPPQSASPLQHLQLALKELNSIPDTRLLSHSSFYRSTPLISNDPQAPTHNIADYINAVAIINTRLAPLDLLKQLQAIEHHHGREPDPKKRPHWGPRPLDLDILSYAAQQIDSADLTIPHPGIGEREFVLIPWAEIAPETELPSLGNIGQLAANIPPRGLQRLPSTPWNTPRNTP